MNDSPETVEREIIEYLGRAYTYDEAYLRITSIDPSLWGWRNHRAIKVAIKRACGLTGRETQDYLDALSGRGLIEVRSSRRDHDSGSDYRNEPTS